LAKEADVKRLVKGVEAKRKSNDLSKPNINHVSGTPSTPTLAIMNISPPEYTPIISIPRDSSRSSQSLNFEGSIVAIGDYYFDNKTRSIENISKKIKRGEESKSKSHAERILEWKVGPNLEENTVQATATLNAFVGLNASFVVEVNNSLNIARTQVIELKIELKDVKDQFDVDVQEVVSVVESLK